MPVDIPTPEAAPVAPPQTAATTSPSSQRPDSQQTTPPSSRSPAPSVPPTASPTTDPSSTPSDDVAGQATEAPVPIETRVWGREDASRPTSEATRPEAPAPWSRLAAVAGAIVVIGGLGTAFARGMQTSAPPVVEEE